MKKLIILLSTFLLSGSIAFAQQAPRPMDEGHEPPERGGILKTMDANGDGNVTPDEFKAGAAIKAGEIFKKLDVNGDNSLSLEEFSNSGMGGKAFEKLDRNHDGVLNKEDRPHRPKDRPVDDQ